RAGGDVARAHAPVAVLRHEPREVLALLVGEERERVAEDLALAEDVAHGLGGRPQLGEGERPLLALWPVPWAAVTAPTALTLAAPAALTLAGRPVAARALLTLAALLLVGLLLLCRLILRGRGGLGG